MYTRRGLLSLALAGVLLCVSCNGSSAITNLDNVVKAAEVALPVVSAAVHLDPAVTKQISTYLQAVDTASVQAATILASTASAEIKAAEIVQAFAAVIAPTLPAGVPQQVVAVVQAVAAAVLQFITPFQPAMASKFKMVPSELQKRTLQSISVRASANRAEAKKL